MQILKLEKVDTNIFNVGKLLKLRTEFFFLRDDDKAEDDESISFRFKKEDQVFVNYGGGILQIEEFFPRIALKEY